MLNYKSSIIQDKKYSGLSIKEISPVMKLNLRGKSREFLLHESVGTLFKVLLLKKCKTLIFAVGEKGTRYPKSDKIFRGNF